MLKLRLHEDAMNTANLYLNPRQIRRIARANPSVIDITRRFEPDRARVEGFIRDIYARAYGADIRVDYPVLMSVRDDSHNILAALGFRYAAHEPLFLEQYTGRPVETILNVPRTQIVEIGNLASSGNGASVFLYAALASYLDFKNIRYAIVTGTDFLHGSFEKLGLRPQKICDADIRALQNGGQNWGSYYDTNPRVLVGSVDKSVIKLKKALGAEFEDCRPRLFPRLHSNTNR